MSPAPGLGSDRRFARMLAVVVVLAVAIRVGFVLLVDPVVPRIGDASAYHLLGRGLARGDGYIRPFDALLLGRERPTAEYPPLFPLLLAFLDRIGCSTVTAQRLALSALGGVTVALTGLLGRRAAGRTVGVVAAAIAAVSPMLFLSEAILMAEALAVPLVAVSLLLAFRAIERPGAARFAALGAALGALTLTRAEGALLAVLLVGPVAWRSAPTLRPRLLRTAVALGVAACVVAPWTIRNAVRLDGPVPISTNAATLVDGANCDATYRGRLTGLWRESFSTGGAASTDQAVACFEGFAIAEPGFSERTAAARHLREGAQYARDHLAELPRVGAVRVLRTFGLWAPRAQVDYESLEGRPRRVQLAGTALGWVLLGLATVGTGFMLRRGRTVWPLLAPVASAGLVSALTYGQQRFRAGAEPSLCVLAAVAVVLLARRIGARHRIRTAAP
ncbi:MAG: glycosyltransferase family 39 protein [Actinomycetota bacterium]